MSRACRFAAALASTFFISSLAWAQQTQDQNPAATAPDPAMVLATVGGSDITLAELMLMVEQLPPQYQQAPLQMLYEPLLKQAIERRLVSQAALKDGIDQDEEVKRRLASAQERLLHRAYLRSKVEPEMSDDKLRARYEKDVKAQDGEDEVRARHILLETREDADAVATELKGGADFAELAKSRSKGPSSSKGGDLGFFKRGDMVPEFSEAAFALDVGSMSEPVQTQFGWHIIKVEERRQGEPPSFEQSVDALREATAKDVVNEVLKTLSGEVEIKAFNLDGTPREIPSLGVN